MDKSFFKDGVQIYNEMSLARERENLFIEDNLEKILEILIHICKLKTDYSNPPKSNSGGYLEHRIAKLSVTELKSEIKSERYPFSCTQIEIKSPSGMISPCIYIMIESIFSGESDCCLRIHIPIDDTHWRCFEKQLMDQMNLRKMAKRLLESEEQNKNKVKDIALLKELKMKYPNEYLSLIDEKPTPPQCRLIKESKDKPEN